ncbi:hypothetical protein [Enterococcus sp. DIV1420a]|uniref:hypothetical protein n=1 Tax=Enterococcus TaxID=1350 RepID=UPI0036D44910
MKKSKKIGGLALGCLGMFLLTACQTQQEEQATKVGYEVEQENSNKYSLSFDQ